MDVFQRVSPIVAVTGTELKALFRRAVRVLICVETGRGRVTKCHGLAPSYSHMRARKAKSKAKSNVTPDRFRPPRAPLFYFAPGSPDSQVVRRDPGEALGGASVEGSPAGARFAQALARAWRAGYRTYRSRSCARSEPSETETSFPPAWSRASESGASNSKELKRRYLPGASPSKR